MVMSAGVEVEDGRAAVLFPAALPGMAGIDGAGAGGRDSASPADAAEVSAGGGVGEAFVMVPCDLSRACADGGVGRSGGGIDEISSRDYVDGEDGLEQAGGVGVAEEDVGNPAFGGEIGNAVGSVTASLRQSPSPNCGQNGSFSDQLVGGKEAGEDNLSLDEAELGRLSIGEQRSQLFDELISTVKVEGSAAREGNTAVSEAEVDVFASDAGMRSGEGPSYSCAPSLLSGCSFAFEESKSFIKNASCLETGSKSTVADSNKVHCDMNATFSQNGNFAIDHDRVTELALFGYAGKVEPLFEPSSLFVDTGSALSVFRKAINPEKRSGRVTNSVGCNVFISSASPDTSPMSDNHNFTSFLSIPSKDIGNNAGCLIPDNSVKGSSCCFLETSFANSCVRASDSEGTPIEVLFGKLSTSSCDKEVGSSAAEVVYSHKNSNTKRREADAGHSFHPLTSRMRNVGCEWRDRMESISLSVGKLRKTRSLRRRGCSFKWGTLGNIISLFKKNENLPKKKNGDAQSRRRLGIAKPGGGKQRQRKKAQASGNGRFSNAILQTNTLLGCSESSHVDHCSLARGVDYDFPEKSNFKVNTGEPLEVAVVPKVGIDNPMTETNILAVKNPGDKDVESSVTQDALLENRSSNCQGTFSLMVSEGIEEATSDKSVLCDASPDSAVLYTEKGSLEPSGELLAFEKSSSDEFSKIISAIGSIDMTPDLISEGNSFHSISSGGGELPEDTKLFTALEDATSTNFAPSNLLSTAIAAPCLVSYTIDSSRQKSDSGMFLNTYSRKKNQKNSSRKPSKKVKKEEFSCKISTVRGSMFAAKTGLDNDVPKFENLNDTSSNASGSLENKDDSLFRKTRKGVRRMKNNSVDSSKASSRRRPKESPLKKSDSRRKKRDSPLGKLVPKIQAPFSSSKADVVDGNCHSNDKNKVFECVLNGTPAVGHHVGLNSPSEVAWVSCDDCEKWRCITSDLADKINATKCLWTCKENEDKRFADCSIPQEKSNEEINAELQLTDGSEGEGPPKMGSISGGVQPKSLDAKQQAAWTAVKHNLFLHRSRRNQIIDEIMVCHCKPPADGGFGCTERCLNRILNIECVQKTCPCGNLCSNQQFQKRKYAKFKLLPYGKKGYGLQLLENVSKGQFLIEYVGEVLDMLAYEARQREYALRGQKHFYFMTLNGSEVIDACAKGNMGRFINHSCDPNCWTEKWMVNGEVCIGLFALRDIKKGEEVTFDYNYVRVFGAAAKKCMCGSSSCRGYLGGDPSSSGAVVQTDSDDEYPEPILIREDGTTLTSMNEIDSDSEVLSISRYQLESPKTSVQNLSHVDGCSSRDVSYAQASIVLNAEYLEDAHIDTGCDDNSVTVSDLQEDSAHFTDSLRIRRLDSEKSEPKGKYSVCTVSGQDHDVNTLLPSDVKHNRLLEESTLPSQMMAKNYALVKNGSKNNKNSIKHKSRRIEQSSQRKSLNPDSVMRKGSSCAYLAVANKSKKSPVGICGRFEGVEEKLNELLDAEGGISRSKDATKGYLKLLFVTAASGDNAIRETYQSTRDLSIILDALLKTKSRTVLHDIINKNGLQMLHNIMKQNRRKFDKTPIIRKLLKVIEFLAAKGVLTSDHINTPPPRDGVESFRDSIFCLTKHNDSQVHDIARRIRDEWIITFGRKNSRRNSARNSSNRSFHKRWLDRDAKPSDATPCSQEPMTVSVPPGTYLPSETQSVSNGNVTDKPVRVRKRKSRWDQPKETNPPGKNEFDVCKKRTIEKMRATIVESTLQHGSTANEVNNEDAPPGFSCPSTHHSFPTGSIPSYDGNVTVALPQPRYLGYLPVSYGIPLAAVQEFGSPATDGTDGWLIAPGVPFHPFPPLPSYPRTSSSCNSPEVVDSQHRESAGSSQDVAAGECFLKPDENLGVKYFKKKKWNKGSGLLPSWLSSQKNEQASKDEELSGGSTPSSANCTLDNLEIDALA